MKTTEEIAQELASHISTNAAEWLYKDDPSITVPMAIANRIQPTLKLLLDVARAAEQLRLACDEHRCGHKNMDDSLTALREHLNQQGIEL